MQIRGLSPGALAEVVRRSFAGDRPTESKQAHSVAGQGGIRSVKVRPQTASEAAQHVFICVADHYEPDWGRADDDLRIDRVQRWLDEFPRLASAFNDSLGRPPQHSFFYPMEEYRPRLLDMLAEFRALGIGDVEVHLHHDNDTSEHLTDHLNEYRNVLFDRHGLLRKDHRGEIVYGFIHGNWALDNSRPDGCWCGVDDELTVLSKTGCYADFTMPAAPAPAQTRTVNSIYYAFDDPKKPKSHDVGQRARVGCSQPDDSLLMIQGPLVFDLQDRKRGILPRLENGDLHADRPPCGRRIDMWTRAGVSVAGRPDWQFVKLHTHGAKEANAEVLLGSPMRELHSELARRAESDSRFRYYYVTAWEMSQLVHAAEAGITDPDEVLGASAVEIST